MSQLTFYLYLSAALFSIGVLGVTLRKNIIIVLMCVELMLNAVNITFVALSRHFGTSEAQVYVFFIMAVAAAEAAVGLAIVLSLFRNFNSVRVTDAAVLKG
jgi:NADH-quinone oxidoreductase subunit K